MIDCQVNNFSAETIRFAIFRGVVVEMIIPSARSDDQPYFHLFMELVLSSGLVYILVDGRRLVIKKYPWAQFPTVVADWDFSKTLIPVENWIDIFLCKKNKVKTVQEIMLLL